MMPVQRARRRVPIAAAVAVVAVASIWWLASAPPQGTATRSDEGTVAAPSLPDLSRVDAAVEQQIRQRHAAVEKAIREGGTGGSTLAEALGAYGTLLLATEYFGEAEAAFVEGQRHAPDDMRWPYYLGHVYRLRQEPARAISMFERALALAPNDAPALVWLAELHLNSGDAAAAEPYLRRASVLQPDSVAVLSRLGRAALARRDYSSAIQHFERALALRPDASSLHYPLGMAYRGAGQTAKAESHLAYTSDEAGVPPEDPLMDAVAGLLRNASAYEARGMQALEARDWKTAVANLREAVALAPDNAVTRVNLGTALTLSGEPGAARRELLEAVRLAPDLAKAHFALGLIAQEEGRWDEAVERLSAAVQQQPDFVDAHFALAEALRRTGRADQALAHYRQVLQLNPAASQARFGQAMALVRLRRFGEARQSLTEAVRLHPDQPGLPHALARLLAASPDARARDGRRALELMEPLKNQQSAAVSETMAMVMAELGRFDDAVEWQSRAIALARDSGQSQLAARMSDNFDRYQRREPSRTPWRDDDPVIAEVAGR